jgi:NAD(P)-dependent dehydrogenase (short-subunit alcohol dehydrogenase family)
MMKQFSKASVPYDIRGNIIVPESGGFFILIVEEKLIEAVYNSKMTGRIIGSLGGIFTRSMVPLEHPGKLEDIADGALFLTSRAGDYLSGSVMITDGGRLCVQPSSYCPDHL